MKVAVIDVGFNSLKMVKYVIDAGGKPRLYGQLGVMARLGEGSGEKCILREEPIRRTIDAIELCREAAAMDGINHTVLVGTSPVREAKNSGEFLRRVYEETGMKMRVLTGDEEALYGFLGAARSVDAPIMVFFDLGGGSLQITYAEANRVTRIVSLPLGVLRLTSQFSSRDGTFSRKNRQKLTKLVSRSIPSRRELGIRGDAALVGTGGTVRAMARFDQAAAHYKLNKIHGYTIESGSVQQMSRDFSRLRWSELGDIDAIGSDRSRTIAAGALVVRILMKRLGFGRLTVSTHGLRDGIVEEFLHRGVLASEKVDRRREVERLLSLEKPVVRSGISAEVVDLLTRNEVFDRRQRSILLAATERAQVRELIESSVDALFGVVMSDDPAMSQRDQLLMAISMVRARKSRTANWLANEYGSMLSREDLKAAKKMGACLRLLRVLDHASAEVKVSYSEGLLIRVNGNVSAFPHRLASASAESLSSAIKRPVKIVVGKHTKHLEPLKVSR